MGVSTDIDFAAVQRAAKLISDELKAQLPSRTF
jgi:hypothetical protein